MANFIGLLLELRNHHKDEGREKNTAFGEEIMLNFPADVAHHL
jgi:hypothetical protein